MFISDEKILSLSSYHFLKWKIENLIATFENDFTGTLIDFNVTDGSYVVEN